MSRSATPYKHACAGSSIKCSCFEDVYSALENLGTHPLFTIPNPEEPHYLNSVRNPDQWVGGMHRIA